MNALRPVLLSTVAAALLLPATPAFAQRSIAAYGGEAMTSLGHKLDQAARDGYVMEARTTRIFGAWLPRGDKTGNEPWISVLIATNLNPEKSYRIIAGGDNDTIDLDLRVLDPQGNVVVEDNLITREPEVTFRPTRQQDYTIQMRLYHSRDNCVCIGAILWK